MSIYWHEIFPGSLDDQLDKVRLRRRLKFGQLAYLLEISITVATALLESGLDAQVYVILDFIRDPLPTTTGKRPDGTFGELPEDPSHCLLTGIDQLDEQLRTAIAQLLVYAVERKHPALKPMP